MLGKVQRSLCRLHNTKDGRMQARRCVVSKHPQDGAHTGRTLPPTTLHSCVWMKCLPLLRVRALTPARVEAELVRRKRRQNESAETAQAQFNVQRAPPPAATSAAANPVPARKVANGAAGSASDNEWNEF